MPHYPLCLSTPGRIQSYFSACDWWSPCCTVKKKNNKKQKTFSFSQYIYVEFPLPWCGAVGRRPCDSHSGGQLQRLTRLSQEGINPAQLSSVSVSLHLLLLLLLPHLLRLHRLPLLLLLSPLQVSNPSLVSLLNTMPPLTPRSLFIRWITDNFPLYPTNTNSFLTQAAIELKLSAPSASCCPLHLIVGRFTPQVFC